MVCLCLSCRRLRRPGYFECRSCLAHNPVENVNCGVCGAVNFCVGCSERHRKWIAAGCPVEVEDEIAETTETAGAGY